MRLEGKIGLVTAAGSGMGRAGAIRFAQEGALVGVVDVDEDAVASVVNEIEKNGGKAKGIVADLTKDADSKRIVTETENILMASTLSGIMSDILVLHLLKALRWMILI